MLHLKFDNYSPLNILCLGAHCDDIELGAGATLLKLFKEYKIGKIDWVVLASDEIRKNEAIKSAEQFLNNIPNSNVTINSFRDVFLPFYAVEIKEYFERMKKEIFPDIIFTHYRNDLHQDHKLLSDLTWNTWRNHLILEYEILKYDGDVGTPNVYVSINEEYIQKRNKILLETFVSQHSKKWFNERTFLALPALRGVESDATYAEAFYSRKIII